MKRICQLELAFVVLMTFVGCGGGGSTSQSMGPNDDFAALLNQVAGPEAMHVQNVVAVGGGSIEGIFNPNPETGYSERNATFSFFAGGVKNCDFFDPVSECDYRGHLVFMRKDIQSGTRGILSKEITKVVAYESFPPNSWPSDPWFPPEPDPFDKYGSGRCVVMTGSGDFKVDWTLQGANSTAPRRYDVPFTLIACDNDGIDTVWWESPGNPGITLVYAIELKGGNIMIR